MATTLATAKKNNTTTDTSAQKTDPAGNAEIDKKIAALRADLTTLKGTPTEVYSRIVGYYRSVNNWNTGKREEYALRQVFTEPSGRKRV